VIAAAAAAVIAAALAAAAAAARCVLAAAPPAGCHSAVGRRSCRAGRGPAGKNKRGGVTLKPFAIFDGVHHTEMFSEASWAGDTSASQAGNK
jgi:opacity protein-like surface antigen